MKGIKGNRYSKWIKFFRYDPIGIEILQCIVTKVPLWNRESNTIEFVSKKIDTMYSSGSDPSHGTSVELYNGLANATMRRSDDHYGIQTMEAIACICHKVGITFEVKM